MKYLFVFFLISAKLYSQIPLGNIINATPDKELSKIIFDGVNQYRDTLNLKPFIWSEFYYQSALKVNKGVIDTEILTHYLEDDVNASMEMYCLVYVDFDRSNTKQISDSVVLGWRSSIDHRGGLEQPIQKKVGDTYTDVYRNWDYILGSKYGAISAIRYDTYRHGELKHIVLVFMHSGQFADKY